MSLVKKVVDNVVDASGKHPFVILLCAIIAVIGSWSYASHLELRSDFLELLPRDSPGFKAFEHQLGRMGGGATLLVISESPERAANQKFTDDLAAKLSEI